MDTVNIMQAGRAVPIIWRLTDLEGEPVDHPESFAGIHSFQTACDGLTTTTVLEEYASGSSGQQYLGNGYWQLNWKTQKGYSGTCRRVYVKFSDHQTSDQVKFQFK